LNVTLPPPAAAGSLSHLPLPLLAVPMGLGGVGLAWRQASTSLGVPALIGEAMLALMVFAWLTLVALHALRALRHPAALRADLRHPVRAPFLAAGTIGLMLVSAALWPYAPVMAQAAWGVSVALHLLIAMWLLRRILGGRGEVAMLAPPLLIPFVGNILAPVFGAPMGFPDASWAMFGVGLVLWLAVMPLLLQRLLAGPPLPAPLLPSIAILVAPPTVGALALMALAPDARGPVLALTGVAVLVTAALLSLAGEIARAPFGLPWWGLTFPSAAFAVLVMATGFHPALGWSALLFATAVTGHVAVRTASMALSGAFTRAET
jgi:tellurite resistance protein